MTRKYSILIFDIDDTLIDDVATKRGAFLEVCKFLHKDFDELTFRKFIHFEREFWDQVNQKKVELPNWVKDYEEEVLWLRVQWLIEIFKLDFPSAVVVNQVYYEALKDNVVPMKNVERVISNLSSKYRLVIATNGEKELVYNKLERANISEYFTDVIIGEEIGVCKPNKEFFAKLIRKIGYRNKKRIAMIGDSLISDVWGALSIGITPLWYNHKNQENNDIVPNENVFYELKDLEKILL